MAENPNALYYAKLQYQRPQISITCPAAGRMWLVSLCALLAIFQSAFSDSFYSLVLAVSAVFAAVLTEYLIVVKNGKTAVIRDGSAVATALILTLLLPNRISPVYAVVGSIFAIAIIKHCFGGLGANWLNPAAGGWLFVRLSWPGAFNKAQEGSPLSPLDESLLQIGFTQPGLLENNLRSFLENTVFSLFRIDLPPLYLNLFASPQPGIIADRGIIALLFGTILITAFRASRTWVPAVWLAVFIFLTRMTGALSAGAGWWHGDILFTLCTGGTLAAAFILAADPATSAKSNWCVLGAAIAGGLFAWLFRFPGAEAYGAIYSVLLVNAILPIVRNLENHWFYRNRRSA